MCTYMYLFIHIPGNRDCSLCVVTEFAWIFHDWAGITIRLFGTEETYEKIGKEFSIFTLSHRGDLDWVAGYVVGAQFDFLYVSMLLTDFCLGVRSSLVRLSWVRFPGRSHSLFSLCNYYFDFTVAHLFCSGTENPSKEFCFLCSWIWSDSVGTGVSVSHAQFCKG